MQNLWLLAASYYFYMALDWRFAGLLSGLTLINYAAGACVVRYPAKARLSVALAVIASILILIYFKYLNFFADVANSIAHVLHLNMAVPYVDVILPVGISFMTFQAITYPIDLAAGRLQKPTTLRNFALFMAFFPRLLSGPIVRAGDFIPQLERPHNEVESADRFSGLVLAGRGLAKKVLLADALGAYLVEPAFSDPATFSSLFLIIALAGYSFQVYLDLSGYTDMALGAARMLGYRLPGNFNRPYLATSIANFWQRWHITMSSFFRDYLYTPLSQAWGAPTAVNLLITFVAIGLWHGAGWKFVLYGLLHGSMVALGHYRTEQRTRLGIPQPILRGSALAMRITFIFSLVALTRLLFRSDSIDVAQTYFYNMLIPHGGEFPLTITATVALALGALLHFTPIRWRDMLMDRIAAAPTWQIGVAVPIAVYFLIVFNHGRVGFIYFQF
ncbi:MBOAT family O-acyltransferase [Pseudoduganella ginsengisoli]|uniref:Probable alginate O-acetylase AlgI n=1 Tax=Pseudoduganella ginsengisoli TaxID=1462440 RepID=A0A6L6Q1N3_9BURK|nr:MBOAT family O-acyltransferase [Pseudoduganella ginsengisoli]MTW03211.1 MBOAT family protein [Pseudoduganella ginsengisoli]